MARKEKLVEGLDFYTEEGKMVLTAHFLSERGYCCGNGCRHCPYPKKNTAARSVSSTDKNNAILDTPPADGK